MSSQKDSFIIYKVISVFTCLIFLMKDRQYVLLIKFNVYFNQNGIDMIIPNRVYCLIKGYADLRWAMHIVNIFFLLYITDCTALFNSPFRCYGKLFIILRTFHHAYYNYHD